MGLPVHVVRRLLAGILASLPALATTTPLSFNVTGTAGSIQTSPTTIDYEAVGAGKTTPFGNATTTLIGSLSATSMSTALTTGTLSITFNNGDSLQFSYSGVNFIFASDGSTSAMGPASVNGGTGKFQNATGSVNFSFSGAKGGGHHGSAPFTLTGSGMIKTAGGSGALTESPQSLMFSFLQGAKAAGAQTLFISSGLQKAEPITPTATGGTWLSITLGSSMVQPSSNAPLIVTANPTGLAAGTYRGSIGITSPGGGPFAVPVTMTISAMAQNIVLSQNGQLFKAAQGAGAPPGQTIAVIDQSSGPVSWTAAVSNSSSSWLSVAPSSGTSTPKLNGTAVISANPSGLQPGDYYGVVYFAATDGPGQSVTVVLTVTGAKTPPGPSILPSGLSFTAKANSASPSSQMIAVTNPASQPITVNDETIYLDTGGWLSVNPPSTTVGPSKPVEFTVGVSQAGLAAGAYRATIRFLLPDGSVQPVDVSLVIASTLPATAESETETEIESAAAAPACSATRLLPVSTMLGHGFKAIAAWPVPLEVRVIDDCGAPLKTGAVGVSFSSGDPALSLIPLGDGRWTGTWQPRSAKAQQEEITVVAESPHSKIQGTAQLNGSVQSNPNTPTIGPGGVVSEASLALSAPLAPGDLISIFGQHFSNGLTKANIVPLPTRLNGTRARIAGEPMPLQTAANGQINAQIPFDVPPNTVLEVIIQNNGVYSLPELVTIASAAPAALTANGSGKGLGVITIVKPDGTQVQAGPNNPASAGDTLVIYCEGLGIVDPPVPSGAATPSNPPSKTTNKVTVTVGGKAAAVSFSGLAPGQVGLYQVNVTLPMGITPGPAVPIVITAAGQSSPPVTLPIQ